MVICGDALHSMSPFKGQGANQALADGPLLARWLTRSSIDAALTNWWREALDRTAPVVEASRKAAMDWHDPDKILACDDDDDNNNSNKDYHGFAGVRPSALRGLVGVLEREAIGPHLGGDLDRNIRDVIRDHGWFDENSDDDDDNNDDDDDDDNNDDDDDKTGSSNTELCKRVLALAARGDTEGLRQLSLPSSSPKDNHFRSCGAMVRARDADGRSCLHLAAIHNHEFTCRWLLAELCVLEQWEEQEHLQQEQEQQQTRQADPASESPIGAAATNNNNLEDAGSGPADAFGKTAMDYATETGNKSLIRLFSRTSSQRCRDHRHRS